MAQTRLDRQAAAAESTLDQLDEHGYDGHDGGALDLREAVGYHVELESVGAEDGDDPDADGLPKGDPELCGCLDALAEGFNARDLDGTLDAVTDDCETPGLATDMADFALAMEDLWLRRPTCLLTRGEIDARALGVLWENDGERWWRVATVHLDDVVDGRAGVVEFSDDPCLVEQVATDEPDAELDEGSRWAEWDEGDGD